MYKYIVKRLLMMIPTLLGAALLVFLLLRAIPGDVCEVRLAGTGLYADPAEIELCRENLGLNKPLILGFDTQFTDFVGGYLTFDLGDSMWTGKPITYEIGLRFKLSLQMAVMATVVAVAFAIPLGIISAVKQDTWIDYAVRTFSIAAIAIPSFWLGIKNRGCRPSSTSRPSTIWARISRSSSGRRWPRAIATRRWRRA
jgi:peptide/nickel transport system permease protein